MRLAALALVTALGVIGTPAPAPIQDPLEARLQRLYERAHRGERAEREAAGTELSRLVQSSWEACYRVYASTRDKRLGELLRHDLGIAWAAGADAVVQGERLRLEQVQGGVIDYHDLYLRFRKPFEVWKGEDAIAGDRIAPDQLRLARGTNRDTWLCDLMARDLERQPADSVLALKRRTLSYRYGNGRHDASFSYFEYRVLPAAAARAREDITGDCHKRGDH